MARIARESTVRNAAPRMAGARIGQRMQASPGRRKTRSAMIPLVFQSAGSSYVAEIDAAILQVAVTLLLAVAAWTLHRRYRKPYLAWFTAAFGLYVLRLLAIVSFLWTRQWGYLYWHQVLTGWTALAILWASIQFSRPGPTALRAGHLLALAFPPVWSYVAIYQLESFLAAALPAVAFLSLVTARASVVFLQHWY